MPLDPPDSRDLELLRRSNTELRERVQRFQDFFALSAGWYWEQDEQHRFTDLGVGENWPANAPPMGSLLGRARWEMPGMQVEGGWDAHRAMLERHEPFRNVEMRQASADGTSVSVMRISGTPVFKDGVFRGYRGIGKDVTEQVAVEAAAREIQREMAALMSNLPGMAYRCRDHIDWPMEFASEGAQQLTGYAPQDLVAGKPAFGELIHPDDHEAIQRSVEDAIAQRRHFRLTYRIRTPHGLKWVWEQGCAVLDEKGQPSCLEGFITDITPAKNAQEEIERLNQSLEGRVAQRTAELEAANRELEAFAYSIAHDLRAPLTSIAGFSRLLEQDEVVAMPERRVHYLKRIRAGVDYMSSLTDALLTLAKVSRAELAMEPLDLALMARTALHQLQLAEPGRKLVAHVPRHLPARGDLRLVTQVIANLVGNAWKFSSKQPETWIEIGSKTLPDGETAFFVADHGEGFDMAYAARMFQPFQRLHTIAEFEGTGIGLALVHKIIERHGGRIWPDARPGQGATFYFTLGSEGSQ